MEFNHKIELTNKTKTMLPFLITIKFNHAILSSMQPYDIIQLENLRYNT